MRRNDRRTQALDATTYRRGQNAAHRQQTRAAVIEISRSDRNACLLFLSDAMLAYLPHWRVLPLPADCLHRRC